MTSDLQTLGGQSQSKFRASFLYSDIFRLVCGGRGGGSLKRFKEVNRTSECWAKTDPRTPSKLSSDRPAEFQIQTEPPGFCEQKHPSPEEETCPTSSLLPVTTSKQSMLMCDLPLESCCCSDVTFKALRLISRLQTQQIFRNKEVLSHFSLLCLFGGDLQCNIEQVFVRTSALFSAKMCKPAGETGRTCWCWKCCEGEFASKTKMVQKAFKLQEKEKKTLFLKHNL